MTLRAALLPLAVLALATGCDPGTLVTCRNRGPDEQRRRADDVRARELSLRRSDLGEGWRAIRGAPAMSVLRPDLDGLVETGRSDSPPYARAGLVARSTTSLFATARDAATAVQRAGTDDYADCLGVRLRAPSGAVRRSGGVVRVQLRVPRAAETGSDHVEVALLSQDRAVVVLELVGDFRAALERRLIARLRARLASV